MFEAEGEEEREGEDGPIQEEEEEEEVFATAPFVTTESAAIDWDAWEKEREAERRKIEEMLNGVKNSGEHTAERSEVAIYEDYH